MTATAPSAYYSVCSDTDPIAASRRQARIAEYGSWRSCMPAPDDRDHRDWTELAATLTRSIGSAPSFIAANLEALDTLDRLPELRRLVEELHHLDMFYLRKIDDALLDLPLALHEDHDFWGILDEELTEYLTPTRANQLLPSPSALTRKIRGIIRTLEPPTDDEDAAASAEEDVAARPGSYRTVPHADGSVSTEVLLDEATSVAVNEAVRAYAAAHDCSQAQALAALVLEKTTVKVVLNLYQAADVENAPAFLLPVGWLTRAATEKLLGRVSLTRDMTAAANSRVSGYQIGEAAKAYLEGRDGVCRWPGCNRTANGCQKDHRINYADGGETTPSNMVNLCQHHHNRKTDGEIFYLLDHVTGDVYWLFQNGTWVCERAEGPLAPRQRRWVRTMAQRRRRREQRARNKAATERRPQPEKSDDATEEPPF